jgi:hypothetical protein
MAGDVKHNRIELEKEEEEKIEEIEPSNYKQCILKHGIVIVN